MQPPPQRRDPAQQPQPHSSERAMLAAAADDPLQPLPPSRSTSGPVMAREAAAAAAASGAQQRRRRDDRQREPASASAVSPQLRVFPSSPLSPSLSRPSLPVRSVSAGATLSSGGSGRAAEEESRDLLSSLSVVQRGAAAAGGGGRGRRRRQRAADGSSPSASPASSPTGALPAASSSPELLRVNRQRSAASAELHKTPSMHDAIEAYVKRTAAMVNERVEDGAATVVKALRGEEEDARLQVHDVQMESLNYDNLLDYVNERSLAEGGEGRAAVHVLLLLKVLMTVSIAFCTAMLMYLVSSIVSWASARRINTAVQWIATGYSALAYFSFVLASICLTAVASFLCTVIAPHARGGGVPYLFAYLNGTNVSKYFTFRIVAVKVCALAFTIAGGLTLGMEGPFVYIGGGVALLLSRGWDLLPGVSPNGKYTRIIRNINEERIFMACGLAAGLAVAFSAPIAGILFAMEGATSFLTISAVLRIFGCSMFAMFFKDLSFNGWSAHIQTTNLITIVSEAVNYSWRVPEVAAFTLMAALGGGMGAVAVHLNVRITRWRHHYMGERIAANMSEVALITGVTSTIMFVLPLMFGCAVMPAFCADNGEVRCQSLFCPLGAYSEIGSFVFSSSDIIARNLFDRTISLQNEYDVFPLLVYMTLYLLLVAWVYGAYVPGGLFVPSIVIGGCYGRVVGHVGSAYVSASINPGVYALIGAAGMLGGFTRLGLPVVVMLVEMTGDATYLLPIMYVATLAKLLADYLEPPLYPQHMAIEHIAQLGDRIPLAIASMSAADIAKTDFQAVHDVDTLGHILDVLDLTKASTLPVIDEQGLFIGQIARASIAYALKYTPLYSSKDAALRKKEPKPAAASSAQQQQQQQHDTQAASSLLTGSGSSASAEAELLSTAGHRELLQAEGAMGDWHDTLDYAPTLNADFHAAHLRYFLNLRPLIDTGVFTVTQETSNKRIHAMFRRIGLSHLCVLDHSHRLTGIITRRSLISGLQQQEQQQQQQHDAAAEHTPLADEAEAADGDESDNDGAEAAVDEEQAAEEPDAIDAAAAVSLAPLAAMKLPQESGEEKTQGAARVGSSRSRLLSSRRSEAVAAAAPHIAVTISPPTPVHHAALPARLQRRKSTVQRIQMHTKDLR